jgi:hypothetical protein
LGAALGGGRGQRRRHGGSEFGRGFGLFDSFVDGAGGVPHRSGCTLGTGEHLGTLVLDRLELPDGPAELLTDLGVSRRGLGGPACDADGLGRQEGGRDGLRGVDAQVAQHAVLADLDSVCPDMGDRPQRVHACDLLDVELVGVERHPHGADVGRHRQYEQRRLCGPKHRTCLAPDHQHVALPGGRHRRLQRVRGDHRARRQVTEQRRVWIVGGDQGAGDRRRDERPWHGTEAELGQDHRQLQDAEPLSANGFRQVDTLQSLIGGGPPIRWRRGDRRFQRLVQHL